MNLNFDYTPLPSPIPLVEQSWPIGTLPLVSTTTNAFNHKDYIEDCIHGFLMQKTTFPVQIVIFDDVSDDGTREIIQKYEAQYPQLIKGFYPEKNTYKKPERKFAVKPRNEVRDIAKYVAICEGDDYWTDPLKLQKQVDFMELNSDYSLCFHNAQKVYVNKDTPPTIFTKLETREYDVDEIIRNWTIPTASVLYRVANRKPYIRNKDFLYGDIVLFLTLASRGKVWAINEVMSAYRIHNKSALNTQARVGEKVIKHHKAIKKHFPQYKSAQNFNLSKQYIYLSRNELKHGKIFSFFNYICKAFIHKPTLFFSAFFKIYFNKM